MGKIVSAVSVCWEGEMVSADPVGGRMVQLVRRGRMGVRSVGIGGGRNGISRSGGRENGSVRSY